MDVLDEDEWPTADRLLLQLATSPPPAAEQGAKPLAEARLRQCARVIEELVHTVNRVALQHNDRSCDYDVCKPIRDAHEILADDDFAIIDSPLAAALGEDEREALASLTHMVEHTELVGNRYCESPFRLEHAKLILRRLAALGRGEGT
jgi:hypothetical protein